MSGIGSSTSRRRPSGGGLFEGVMQFGDNTIPQALTFSSHHSTHKQLNGWLL